MKIILFLTGCWSLLSAGALINNFTADKFPHRDSTCHKIHQSSIFTLALLFDMMRMMKTDEGGDVKLQIHAMCHLSHDDKHQTPTMLGENINHLSRKRVQFIYSLNDVHYIFHVTGWILLQLFASLIIWLSGLRVDADFKAVKWDRCVACEHRWTVDQMKSWAFLVWMDNRLKKHTMLWFDIFSSSSLVSQHKGSQPNLLANLQQLDWSHDLALSALHSPIVTNCDVVLFSSLNHFRKSKQQNVFPVHHCVHSLYLTSNWVTFITSIHACYPLQL